MYWYTVQFIYNVQTVVVVNLNYIYNDIAKWFLLLFVRLYTWISVSTTNLVVFCSASTGPSSFSWSVVCNGHISFLNVWWFLHVYKMWTVSCSAKWLNYTIKFNFTSGYYVQQGYRPWKNERCMFLEGASRKLIRGCSENRRKGIIYYFQIKINMYAVLSHSIPFIT